MKSAIAAVTSGAWGMLLLAACKVLHRTLRVLLYANKVGGDAQQKIILKLTKE